jgi:hypothetical protein
MSYTRFTPVLSIKNPILLGYKELYSVSFSFSLMAITDNCGKTWQFSEPLVAPGNIQPSIAKKADGTLVAYMRDNGTPNKTIKYARFNEEWVMQGDTSKNK